MGRTLTPGGQYTEIHDYLHGFVERFIPTDKLSTILETNETAQRPLCVIIKTGNENNYVKVLGLHLTEDEHRMVQALNGDLFQDVPYKKGDSSLLISLLKKNYRKLATRIKHKDGPRAHIYDLLDMTEEEMVTLGKQRGNEIAAKLGIQRTHAEGTQAAPESGHHHGHGKERG